MQSNLRTQKPLERMQCGIEILRTCTLHVSVRKQRAEGRGQRQRQRMRPREKFGPKYRLSGSVRVAKLALWQARGGCNGYQTAQQLAVCLPHRHLESEHEQLKRTGDLNSLEDASHIMHAYSPCSDPFLPATIIPKPVGRCGMPVLPRTTLRRAWLQSVQALIPRLQENQED